jgi:NAD(P)H-hydrate epimerase
MSAKPLEIPADLPRLAPRDAESYKYDYGRVLLVGGSLGMTGAISLSGMAALRSGAGLVSVAVPKPCLPIVAQFEPSYMTAGLPADADGRFSSAARAEIETLAEKATAIGCGPGSGRSHDLAALIPHLYTSFEAPAVFDADALWALAEHRDVLERAAGLRVLTPHGGEFRRLLEEDAPKDRGELEDAAVQFAKRYSLVLVLKGQHTLVTDGQQAWHNTTGNPGMATGGTGDVLTGVITALMGQKLSSYDAARLGVFVHGLAGDLAAEEQGEVSLIASDLLRFLPAAFQRVGSSTPARSAIGF